MASARISDQNGWFTVPRNPLSRPGIFEYSGKQINGPDPNKRYKVLRSPDELKKPETVQSFKLLPLIDDHVMLGQVVANAVPAEQKGVHGIIGDNVTFDEETQTLVGNLKVFSETLDTKIDNGKVELSLGYIAKYDFTPGVFNGETYDAIQYDIRGNHVALVDKGRMGSEVAVLDESNSFVVTFDAKDIVKVALNQNWIDAQLNRMFTVPEKKSKDGKTVNPTVVVMDAAIVEASKTIAPTLEDVIALFNVAAPKVAALVATVDAMEDDEPDDDEEAVMDAAGKPVMDADGKPMMQKKKAATMDKATVRTTIQSVMDEAISKAIAPLTTELAALKSKQPDMKALLVQAGKRDALAHKLSVHVGTFDHSEMSVDEVAKYGVDKLKIPSVAGHEVTAVEAWLHGRPAPRSGYSIGTVDAKDTGNVGIADYLAA